ncbi:GNAT family N-acetyltransferase [Vibrio scophthalmi]|uniref:Acetyltransferase, gnat family protein n=1 Tax=Vibrio scophthalmi LMG 19158 TaxID=870967 RepID=F9RM40_9VIBR|nr:GNAT family N-acetyltransferase [Vibrio scophthalmi]EGU38740.1 acetyltransferase, gnat family protein [Vibrio scophthalmi LMG 19158]
MNFRYATPQDVSALVRLQNESHVSNISQQHLGDGFLNTVLNEKQLLNAINHQQAVYVAEFDNKIIAMAVCACWQFWYFSSSMKNIAKNIHNIKVVGGNLTETNSLFWGPVCVSRQFRGQGIFASLFEYARTQSSAQYRYIYTVIHQANRRSRSAHINKVLFVNKGALSIDQQPFTQLVRTAR